MFAADCAVTGPPVRPLRDIAAAVLGSTMRAEIPRAANDAAFERISRRDDSEEDDVIIN